MLASLNEIAEDHPDFVAVRHATSRMVKAVKQTRRRDKRAAIAQADGAVVAATATGAPDRIDDETRGLTLTATVAAPIAGTFAKPRPCYICKQKYSQVDAFYHQLCPACATLSHAKRHARTDLDRQACAAHGRARKDRHAHCAAAACATAPTRPSPPAFLTMPSDALPRWTMRPNGFID